MGMQGAFGVTGVEGLYRGSCQAVLTALRRNRQAVTLLMEAILGDPLVEWAPHREDAAANQVSMPPRPPPGLPPPPPLPPICTHCQCKCTQALKGNHLFHAANRCSNVHLTDMRSLLQQKAAGSARQRLCLTHTGRQGLFEVAVQILA